MAGGPLAKVALRHICPSDTNATRGVRARARRHNATCDYVHTNHAHLDATQQLEVGAGGGQVRGDPLASLSSRRLERGLVGMI